METTTKTRMHPLTAIAAVSVTLFSLAGIGAITGLIPTSHSQSVQAQQTNTAEAPVKPAPAVTPTESTAAATAPSTPKPAVRKVAAARPRPVEHAAPPAPEPVKEVKTEAPVMVAQTTLPPMNAPAPVAAPAKPLCYDCGVVESVREVEKKGEGSGAGAVVGGIAGGLLGRQTGGGRGRDAMTVLGAIGGAVAGNAIEKNVKKVKSYEINIRFEDGTNRVIAQDTAPAWRSGDKVRLVNGVIAADNGY